MTSEDFLRYVADRLLDKDERERLREIADELSSLIADYMAEEG